MPDDARLQKLVRIGQAAKAAGDTKVYEWAKSEYRKASGPQMTPEEKRAAIPGEFALDLGPGSPEGTTNYRTRNVSPELRRAATSDDSIILDSDFRVSPDPAPGQTGVNPAAELEKAVAGIGPIDPSAPRERVPPKPMESAGEIGLAALMGIAAGYEGLGRSALMAGSAVTPGKTLGPSEVAGLKHPWDATEEELSAGLVAGLSKIGIGPENVSMDVARHATQRMYEEEPLMRLASPANWAAVPGLARLGTGLAVEGARAGVAGARKVAPEVGLELQRALGRVPRETPAFRTARDAAIRQAEIAQTAKSHMDAMAAIGRQPPILVPEEPEWLQAMSKAAQDAKDAVDGRKRIRTAPSEEAIDFGRGRSGGESITGPEAGRVVQRTIPGETVSRRTESPDFFGETTPIGPSKVVQEGVQTTAPRTESVVRDELYPWWREAHEFDARQTLRGELKAQGTGEAHEVLDDIAKQDGYKSDAHATAARRRAGLEPETPAPEPPPAPGAAPGSTTLQATVPGVHPLLRAIGSLLFGDVDDAATVMRSVVGQMPKKDVTTNPLVRGFRALFGIPEANIGAPGIRPFRDAILTGRREVFHANKEITDATKALKRVSGSNAEARMERVFDALDGRRVDPDILTGADKVLYEKWRKWLDRIQEVMGEAKDNPDWGIRDYVTHIFPEAEDVDSVSQWVAYGMNEVPRKKAFRYFDKMRKGTEGYSRSLDDVQQMYLSAAIRKAHMNKALAKVKPYVEGRWERVFADAGQEAAGTAPLHRSAQYGWKVRVDGEGGEWDIVIRAGDDGQEVVNLSRRVSDPTLPDRKETFDLWDEPGVPSAMAKRLSVKHGGLAQIEPGQALLEPLAEPVRKLLRKFGFDADKGYKGGNFRLGRAKKLMGEMQGKIYKNSWINRWFAESIYQQTLGMMNVHMALHNLIGGSYMTIADAGLSNFAQAAAGLVHRSDRELLAFLRKMKPELRDFYMYQEYGMGQTHAIGSRLEGVGKWAGKTKRGFDKLSYGAFNAVEGPINRDIAAGAFFVKGRRLGLKGDDMVNYVREGIARTQFYYMLTDSPGITRIPVLGPIASQLMTYTMRAGNRFAIDFSRGARAALAGDAKGAKRYFGRIARKTLYSLAIDELLGSVTGRSITSVVGMRPGDLPFVGDVVRRQFGSEAAEMRIPGIQGIHGVEAPGMEAARTAIANLNNSDPNKWSKWWARHKGIVGPGGLQGKQIGDITGYPDWMPDWMGNTEYTGETAPDGTPEIRLLDRKGELIRKSSVGIEAKDIWYPGQNKQQESLYNAADQVRIQNEGTKARRSAALERARQLHREAKAAGPWDQDNPHPAYERRNAFMRENAIAPSDLKASMKARPFNKHIQTIAHSPGQQAKAEALLHYVTREGFSDLDYINAFNLCFPQGPRGMTKVPPETKRQVVDWYLIKKKRLR